MELPPPPVVTCSGGNCSGWYASYLNAFLLQIKIKTVSVLATGLVNQMPSFYDFFSGKVLFTETFTVSSTSPPNLSN